MKKKTNKPIDVANTKCVLIVFGMSSAYLYVQDAWKRGYTPIIMNPSHAPKGPTTLFKKFVGDNAIFIDLTEEPENDPQFNELRKYNIIRVVAGSEGGSRYVDRVANLLGMKVNDPATTYKRITKKGMHEALKDAGLRYIKTATIRSDDDVRKFWEENNLKKGIIKYSENASSYGNKIVNSIEEGIEHYHKLDGKKSDNGVDSDVLIQEFIDGDEYIVDTMSLNGRHMLIDTWKYDKKITSSGAIAYNTTMLCSSLEPGMYDLIKYAYKVLTATGFENGPCHGEYKIDDKGPVLIETNARPLGAGMSVEFLDECLGHHATDIHFTTQTDEDYFEELRKRPYRPKKYAGFKNFIMTEDGEENLMPATVLVKNLRSFDEIREPIENKPIRFRKTDDLDSVVMTIKFCHHDKGVIDNDVKFISELDKYNKMIFEVKKKMKTIRVNSDYEKLLDEIPRKRNVLVVTNNGRFTYKLGVKKKVRDNAWVPCDDIIYARTKGSTLTETYSMFLKEVSQLRTGGRIAIVPEMFEKIPYGTTGIQLLLTAANCITEVPIFGHDEFMFGCKI